jgi:hypothetical protein
MKNPGPWLALALLCAGGSGANAQPPGEAIVILSDDRGNEASIGAMRDLREGLTPAALAGPAIVDEFKRLCLDTGFDPAAHAAAAAASSWGFARVETVLPAERNRAEARMVDFRAPSAISSLWRGENGDALRGRPYARRSRGVSFTSGVSPNDFWAPQCSLSLRVSGLTDAAPLAAALEAAIGAPATRAVLRDSFADGHWMIAAGSGPARRVSFDVVDMNRPAQLVHLTVQTLPAGRH